jgi:hypothetical protein
MDKLEAVRNTVQESAQVLLVYLQFGKQLPVAVAKH